MELNLVLAMLMLWIATSLAVAVVVGRTVRLRDASPIAPPTPRAGDLATHVGPALLH